MNDTNICREPVVTIVGHIDHGKTTLLDYIRKSSVAAKEAGGITQRISAYEIEHTTKDGVRRALTFIDTPGHEAFQSMRVRGAGVADIAVLIVAADDGVKPQTKEAYKAIVEAKVPFVVAFTKIDKDTANVERAKETVMREEIYLEGLGGDVPYALVSGKTGEGVPELLELLVLVADLHNVECDAKKPVSAVVIESSRDPRSGVSATVIVKEGTLEATGFAVAGTALAPLRAIEDARGARVKRIPCGKPARIMGFTEEPAVGSIVVTVHGKREAEELAAKNARKPAAREKAPSEGGERPALRVILKADTAGSVEALEYELGKIPRTEVDIVVVDRGIGTVSETDVKRLVGFAPAMIAGFNVKIEPVAKDLADRNNIVVETRPIIYELAEVLTAKARELAPPPEVPASGAAHILKHFSSQGVKHVVGGAMTLGTLKAGERVVIVRRGVEVGSGKITNLQQKKNDVSAVSEGEFGLAIETKVDVIAGDTVTTKAVATLKK